MQFFDRRYQLIIGVGSDKYIITDHRIQFEIEIVPNFGAIKGTVKIYNLNLKIRRAISRRIFDLIPTPDHIAEAVTVTLSAGYKDNIFLIINGQAITVQHQREAPDWITELEVLVSIEQFSNIMLDSSSNFDGLTDKQIIDRLSQSLINVLPQYTQNALTKLSQDQASQVVPQSRTEIGPAWQALRILLGKHELAFYLTNTLLIYQVSLNPPDKINSNDSQLTLFTLSDTTGLIGPPQINKMGVEAKALINNEITPFKRIMIESQVLFNTLGFKKAEMVPSTVRYVGDSRAESWYVEFVAFYGDIIPVL